MGVTGGQDQQGGREHNQGHAVVRGPFEGAAQCAHEDDPGDEGCDTQRWGRSSGYLADLANKGGGWPRRSKARISEVVKQIRFTSTADLVATLNK